MTNLTPLQSETIKLLSESSLVKKFYWTGGTLLSYHYLHHRNSLDLDFFTEEIFSLGQINSFLEKLKKETNIKKVGSQKIFDRWEFILENEETLRIEFVYYNHDKKTLHPREKFLGIYIDSLKDIAANKTLAFFDRNEPKDLFDLYFLITKAKISPQKLLSLVEKKFGATFSESSFWSESFKALPILKDIKPLMVEKTQKDKEDLLSKIEDFFKSESKKFLNQHLL